MTRHIGPAAIIRGAMGLLLPCALVAQTDMPSADEVRQALETLRRFERAVAAQPPGAHETMLSNGPAPDLPDGYDPLTSATVGSQPAAQVVEVPDSYALTLDGDLALDGALFKDGAPFLHNDGGASAHNTALGWRALVNVTPGTPYSNSGTDNTAIGHGALFSNTTGFDNTAIGYRALRNSSSSFGTAVGSHALFNNTSGAENTAVGIFALSGNKTGGNNVAIGNLAMSFSSTGSYNTAIGRAAGSSWNGGNHNIAIGSGAWGNSADFATIRIGGMGRQLVTFIEGIHGATATGGSQVFINSSNQLGTSTSSARFKQNIRDLEGVTDRLLALRPVSFRYKDELVGSEPRAENPLEYGLIAEEVAEIFPELVANDEDGNPYTVRYHLLTPLLLAEIQTLEERLSSQDKILLDLRRQLQEEAADHQLMVVDLVRRLDEIDRRVRRPKGDQE